MRKIFIILMLVMGISSIGAAQNSPAKVERKGKTFIQTKSSTKAQPVATEFNWQDSKGNEYPIFINTASGRCFVMKVSGKTGKEYKYYLPEEVAREVCKEMGVEYKEKGGTK